MGICCLNLTNTTFADMKRLLGQNQSFTIPEQNLQYVTIEAYNGLFPIIMNDVFQFAKTLPINWTLPWSVNHHHRRNMEAVRFSSHVSIKTLGGEKRWNLYFKELKGSKFLTKSK